MSTALLLSGGIDSTALAYWHRPELAYTVSYGQAAAAAEIDAACAVCKDIGCRHIVLTLKMDRLGCGIMAGHTASDISPNEEWWPFRNQFLLTVVGMHAVQQRVDQLLIGTVKGDSRHADGSRRFVDAINDLMSRQEGGLKVCAPALKLTTQGLIAKTKLPSTVLLRTHSCHRGNTHCCNCPGCQKRLDIFRDLKLTDGPSSCHV